MTAQSLSTSAVIFPDGAGSTTGPINDTAGFQSYLDGTIQTLSANGSPQNGVLIQGLLFVPSLLPHDPCNNITSQFVPQNAFRLGDTSQFSDHVIALAPWVSPACTRSFLNASREAQTQALIFFHPASNDTGKPPPGDDPSWALGGSYDWKNNNGYAVFAVPGPTGRTLMHQLSVYSKNSPNSSIRISPTLHGEVRLYSVIDLVDGSRSPNLWGYILAILGSILIFSVGIVLCYQLFRRRRQTDLLRQQIATGQIDLEQLGISHIKVPREILDRLPVYPYPGPTSTPTSGTPSGDNAAQSETVEMPKQEQQPATEPNPSPRPTEVEKEPSRASSYSSSSSAPKLPEQTTASKPDTSDPSPAAPTATCRDNTAVRPLSHSQTTCAICLDDFVPQTSTVRELPCGHIFHSNCIDTFLTQNSCLCPLCKKNVLRPGLFRAPASRRTARRGAGGRSRESQS